jgi:hypothetical protein
MEKMKIALLLILPLILTTSCERSDPEETDECFIVGSTSKVIIDHIDIVLGYGCYNIDLNADGKDDFRLCSYNYPEGRPLHSPSPGSRIESLHQGAMLLLSDFMDTTYAWGISGPIINNNQRNTIISYYDCFSCSKHRFEDSIVSIQKLTFIREINEGDTLNKTDNFSPDTIDLVKNWYELSEERRSYAEDTLIIWYNLYDCDKYKVTNNKTIYLGLKLDNRYGWIKLSFSDYLISIFETSIQD